MAGACGAIPPSIGGCKVSADEGDLDASVATRWQELCRLAAPSGVMTTRLTRWLTTLDNFEAKMAQLPAVRRYGRLTRATGLVLEATGLQLPLGATCVIERQNGSETHEVESEVVGFNGQRLFLMPLEEVEGVLPGARVYAKNISAEGLQSGKQLPLGSALLGRVLDGSGKPLDGLPSPIRRKPVR